jgi:hypothetical protein
VSHVLPEPFAKAALGKNFYTIEPEVGGTFILKIHRSKGLPEVIVGLSEAQCLIRVRSLKGYLGYHAAAATGAAIGSSLRRV